MCLVLCASKKNPFLRSIVFQVDVKSATKRLQVGLQFSSPYFAFKFHAMATKLYCTCVSTPKL